MSMRDWTGQARCAGERRGGGRSTTFDRAPTLSRLHEAASAESRWAVATDEQVGRSAMPTRIDTSRLTDNTC
eukprot:1210746-Rhodomonas_salina.1